MGDQTADLAELIEHSKKISVLTGAGISTESGIPDFRSPGGVWTKYRIVEYQEFVSSDSARMEDWERRFAMHQELQNAKPNAGHQALKELVTSGKCTFIVTQNIDRLHQLSGLADEQVLELHGNARRAACIACGDIWSIEQCQEFVNAHGSSPTCRKCSGVVKCNVVMFGEGMPKTELTIALQEAETCDLFLSIGTSLTVHPAASLPVIASRSGAKLAIVNRDPTPLDSLADLVINDEIGVTLAAAMQR